MGNCVDYCSSKQLWKFFDKDLPIIKKKRTSYRQFFIIHPLTQNHWITTTDSKENHINIEIQDNSRNYKTSYEVSFKYFKIFITKNMTTTIIVK
jgi:hypothetical protein